MQITATKNIFSSCRRSNFSDFFTKPKQANKKEYESLILALAKKNYLNKLINKDNIKENKINLKLLQFLGVKKIKENDDLINDKNINNDKNDDNKENNNNLIGDDNNAIKKSFENGLEFEINYEEKEEVVKDFENQFFKSL